MSIDLILYVVAFILMLLAAFQVPAKVSWFHLSLATLILRLIV